MQEAIYNNGADPETAWNDNSQDLVVAAKVENDVGLWKCKIIHPIVAMKYFIDFRLHRLHSALSLDFVVRESPHDPY